MGKLFGIIIGFFVLFTMFGNKDGVKKAEMKRAAVIAEYNLSEEETNAYRACDAQMIGKKFKPKNGITLWPVPDEVCACHAKTMVKYFKPGEYRGNSYVINFLADEDAIRRPLQKNDLIDPSKSEQTFLMLAQSVGTCAMTYANEHNQKQKAALSKHLIENPEMCVRSSNESVKSMCADLKNEGKLK